MRRLALIVPLFAAVGLLAATTGAASTLHSRRVASRQAHAASTVHLVIVRARDGETAALVPVVIHGRTFPFLIDTGATRSVVDLALARKLGLKTAGKPTQISGVGCTSSARNVRLSNWRVGSQSLPSIVVTSTRIAGANGNAFGLLGSDVLWRFGSVRIDYRHARLTLG